jgi:mono/diheme cytochrome c family protein
MVGRVGVACTAAALLASTCMSQGPTSELAPTADPVARGESLYQIVGCASCHERNSTGQRRGPPLDHIGTAAATRLVGMSADEYIRQSILDPTAYEVPGFEGFPSRSFDRALSTTELEALVAYLLSLK